ncbi:hypothetical protein J2786_003589 [Chryseobacterium vietnamense]|uniref:Uncharacterized protein n=1 Tax=Chryseobacterium vietnamense TaxID=866785 RepID=A0ACC6JC70_9FLAO|nr:hypothetical protein [Chryseobacterium vietnamense]MDR6460455.1 hypothetical protein [Chryseobacterium vietnamense]
MKEINKTFEFHYEIGDEIITVKGIITSFTCSDDISLDNVDTDNYRDAIFDVSLLVEPAINSKIFNLDCPLVYIVGFGGRDGQLGHVKNHHFVPVDDQDELVQAVSTSILEVLMMNGQSGHFIDH